MKSGKNLITLISKMSPQERSHFKQYYIGKRKVTPKYILLFNMLIKSDLDNVDIQIFYQKVNKKLSIKSESEGRSLQNYLYDQIVKSLVVFNLEQSEFYDLQVLDVLVSKNLRSNSIGVIKELDAKFTDSSEYFLLGQLKKIQDKLARRSDIDKQFMWSYQRYGEILENALNYYNYNEIKVNVFVLAQKIGVVRSKEEEDIVLAYLSNEYIANPQKAKHINASYELLHIKSILYYLMGDFTQELACSKEAIDLLLSHQSTQENWENKFFSMLFNGMFASAITRNEAEYLKLNNIFQNYITTNKSNKINYRVYEVKLVQIFMDYYQVKTDAIINNANHYKEIIEQGKINMAIDIVAESYFTIAKAFFSKGDYNNALIWNNYLLNDMELNPEISRVGVSKILNGMIHYELGNRMMLDSIVKSNSYFFEKLERNFKTEKSISQFFKKLSTVKSRKEEKIEFDHFLLELNRLYEDPYEKNFFIMFNIRFWVIEKINEL